MGGAPCGDLLVAHLRPRHGLGEQARHRLDLLVGRGVHGEQPAVARLDHERALFEEGVEQPAAHVGRDGPHALLRLDAGDVAPEVAAPDGLALELEDGRILRLRTQQARRAASSLGRLRRIGCADYRRERRRSRRPPKRRQRVLARERPAQAVGQERGAGPLPGRAYERFGLHRRLRVEAKHAVSPRPG